MSANNNPENPTNGDETATKSTADSAGALPAMTFATFIVSLNHSALVHLGVVEDPSSGQKSKNLVLAKQTIDVLGMLEEKTRGNLSDDEQKMLTSILYDLRVMYVRERE